MTIRFLLDSVCRHNTEMVYLDDYDYGAEGDFKEEIPAGGCFYVFLWVISALSAFLKTAPRHLLCFEEYEYGGIGCVRCSRW